jgi:hypothetical protein
MQAPTAHRILNLVCWPVLGAALFVTAYLRLMATFMPYDDEGYILISLRNYLAGLRLYDDVFSQYGPWPFVYHALITQAGGTEMTHLLGRILTAVHWTATALLCGRLGWKLTGRRTAGYVSTIAVFGLTWQMASEPSHPGSHIAMLVACAAVLACELGETRRPGLVCALFGMIVGLLLMTKINVGLLLSASLGCLALGHTGWKDGTRGWAAGLAVAGLLALPWVYFGTQVKTGWVLVLAIQFTLAVAAIAWLSVPRSFFPQLHPRIWLAVPASAVATVGVICLWQVHRGTAVASLFHGILINPLRLSGNFQIGIHWYPEVWLLDLAGALVAIRAGWERRTQGQLAGFTVWLVVGLRLLAVVWFGLHIREWAGYYGILHFAVYCLPALPVFLVPVSESGSPGRGLALGGVVSVALLQVLHAYPVAGSQLAWATFLCVPVFVAGLYEAVDFLGAQPATIARRAARAFGPVLLAGCLFQLGAFAQQGWHNYTTARPLGLPGAEDLRLDAPTRQALRLLNLNARIHADLLYSRPGMFSHNIWSEVPTPTAQNTTQWFWLLDDARQGEIAKRLDENAHSALITTATIDRFMTDHRIPSGGRLDDFVRQHFRPLFTYGGFTFHVPDPALAVTFGRYELLEASSSAGAEAQPMLFRTCIALDGRVGDIRLDLLDYPWTAGPGLLTGATQVLVEPIDRTGRALREPVQLGPGQELKGLFRLSVFSPRFPTNFPWQEYLLVVRNVEGQVLSESVH